MDPVYSAARVDAPLKDAAAGFDRLIADHDGSVTIEVDGGSLVLHVHDALFTQRGRRFRGVVTVGSFRRVPVEIELAAWSHAKSELSLRPTVKRIPISARRYFAVSGLALETIAAMVERRARLSGVPMKVVRAA